MKEFESQDLMSKVDSQYKLVVMASKRVKSLSHGAQSLAEKKKSNLIDVALEEIAEGKITYENEKKE